MTFVIVAMLFVTLLAVGVVAYVAYPHRGEEMPYVPQLGKAMGRAVDALPTLDEEAAAAAGRRR